MARQNGPARRVAAEEEGRTDRERSSAGARERNDPVPVSVVIVDDHRSFGEALAIALDREPDLRVLDVLADGTDGVRVAIEDEPDVVLIDLRMPGIDGVEATRRIREARSRSDVVVMSDEADDVELARSIRAGARGFVLKAEPLDALIDVIRRAHRGEPLHRPAELNRALKAFRERGQQDDDLARRVQRLTPRELEILQALADGLAPDRIAAELGMSKHTLRTHTQNILTKLRVHSKVEAIVAAIRFGKVRTPGVIVRLPESEEIAPATES